MEEKQVDRISAGIPGLDEVLRGGFIPGRSYLVRGGPGTGKTILGLHYLTAGVASGEKALFICLGEQEEQIRSKTPRQWVSIWGKSLSWI